MSESTFGTWTVPESPVDIEYSMIVIDEIRQAVAEGFQRLSRGGIEVGGILYGTVVGRKLRIMAVREIACEHARGPTFHLSDNDRALLTAQLERERDDPRLSGMVAVGWYLSHTRSEITLQQNDLDVYSTFFPEPWQVTMVIRPERASSMRAGFFVRESDGTVKTDHSYHDFAFPDKLAGILDRPARERGERGERLERRGAARLSEGTEAVEAAMRASLDADDVARHEDSGFRQPVRPEVDFAYPGAPRKLNLPWAALAVVAVGVVLAVVGMRFFGPHLNVEPIGLAMSEHEGELRIQWNPASRSIRSAARASIEITDGGNAAGKQVIDLTPTQLASGNLTYARKSGDVQIRMAVSGSGGPVEEGSRFLGNPPDKALDAGAEAGAGAPAAVGGPDSQPLQDEVTRLRAENSQQAERIRRLERTLTILRSRLGIADASQ